jgi:hypothetical protein
MAIDIRERAKEILSVVPPLGQQINSVGATAALFTKLTGRTQSDLQTNWDSGGIMTTCNEFVGWFGREIGSKKFLGRFDIEQELKTIGRSDAWIPASSGERPKYGDIFRPTKFHMGISLDFEGEMWNTVESGQGGKRTGYDIIKRKQQKWDPNLIQGWVDIEIFLGIQGQPALPVPDWLTGWWNVTWRDQLYYYYFDRNREVKWTKVQPQGTTQPPLMPMDTGKVTIEPLNVITVRWNATGSVEKFVKAPVVTEQMGGSWNDKELLTAYKM